MPLPLKSLLICAIVIAPGTAFADWTGGYVGLSAVVSTEAEIRQKAASDVETFPLERDEAFSVFGGYQVQQGNYVFGGEIALSQADDFRTEGIGKPDLEFLDFKARAGYAINDFLLYGVAGPTQIDMRASGAILALNGFNVGIGAEYMFYDQFLIGAEYLARRTGNKVQDQELEIDLDTITLRAAYKF
ncbi:outer membrane protein [Loktanella agnita]|uniref:outer membrane protein n=1 Tax=Loktanella agnita TaxID=287097 RepID=UPI003988C3DA